MQAVGYARISIHDQSQNSLPGQVDRITQYCQRNGLTLHKVFIENGQSAFNFARKEWKDLEKYLKEHKEVNHLVIDTMDRFSRANLADALQKMDYIQKRTGVKILTVSDPINIDLDDFGTDLRRIMELMFSNYELKKIRKRTSDGLYQSMASGRWVNKAPFGYINSRDEQGSPILSVDDDKAYVVRMVFRQYLSGMQLEEIRKHSAANGMKLKGNSAIRRILSNPLYAGLISLPKHGHNPPAVIKAIHPPVISEYDYWTVQGMLSGKGRATQRHENVYLKGALHCHCGQKMSTDKARGKSGKYYHYYICKVHRKNYSAVKLHKQMDEILDMISLPDESIQAIREFINEAIEAKMNNKGGDIMRTQISLKKVLDKIEATQERYLTQSDISEKVYKKVMGELKSDEIRLRMQLADLNATKSGYTRLLEELLPRLANTKKSFHALSLSGKTSFLNLVFGNSLVYRDQIFRTPYLHPVFSRNELELKEKGLLIVEQPDKNSGNIPGSSGNGSWLEHLTQLWDVFAA